MNIVFYKGKKQTLFACLQNNRCAMWRGCVGVSGCWQLKAVIKLTFT